MLSRSIAGSTSVIDAERSAQAARRDRWGADRLAGRFDYPPSGHVAATTSSPRSSREVVDRCRRSPRGWASGGHSTTTAPATQYSDRSRTARRPGIATDLRSSRLARELETGERGEDRLPADLG